MGARANYVLVDDRGWKLFYAHWGAQFLDIHLAPGPDAARSYVEGLEPVDPPVHWLDDRWAEGGFLLDFTRRKLCWFGTAEDMHELPYRRAFQALLARTWPDWTRTASSRGLADLLAYVGQDPSVAAVPELLDQAPRTGFRPPRPRELAEGWWYLVTVGDRQGQVRGFATSGHGDHPFAAGARLPELITQAGAALGPIISAATPLGGVHLETAARRAGWWSPRDEGVLLATTSRAWPGWNVQFWDDDYERHETACGLALPAVDLRRGFDELEDRLHHVYAGRRAGPEPSLRVDPDDDLHAARERSVLAELGEARRAAGVA